MSAKPFTFPLVVVALFMLAHPAFGQTANGKGLVVARASTEALYRVTILDGDTVIDEAVRPVSGSGSIKMERPSSTPLISQCGTGPAKQSLLKGGLDVEVRPTEVANQIKVDYEIRLRSFDPQPGAADCKAEPPKAKVSRSAGTKTLLDPSQDVVLGEVGNFRVKFGLVGR
jgi:hypothetical protein